MTKPLFGDATPAHPSRPVQVMDVQPNIIPTISNPIVAATLQPAVVPQRSVALRTVTDQEIDSIGVKHAQRAAETSKQILSVVKTTDTDKFGSQLNELIATTKQLDPQKAGKKGIVAKVTGLFSNAKEQVLSQLQTVEQRINTLTSEMDKNVVLYTKRIGDIEKMYIENEQTFIALGQEINSAGELLQVLNTQLATEKAATDAFGAQHVADLEDRIVRVEKKIDDLQRAQYLCKLAAPELRMMQSNSRSLTETFTNIKNITIPAYIGVYSRFVLNIEAKRGAELATSVADATNEAFRMQADLLRDNTVAIATAKQRSIVDISTIEHMQTQLLAAMDDAKKIADEGRKARQEAAPKLQQMEQELVSRFVPQQLTH